MLAVRRLGRRAVQVVAVVAVLVQPVRTEHRAAAAMAETVSSRPLRRELTRTTVVVAAPRMIPALLDLVDLVEVVLAEIM
jgi:hypothetical protein